ncbi:MAG: RDD family protein [Verrucomicrobia bacterium]|nr:RDD family protein [Verrucomicrobiota bacterium]MCH8528517.1 RDD family protein [Kiritimatiellia bacterium]
MRKEPVYISGRKPAAFGRRLLALVVDALIVVLIARVWMLFAFEALPGPVLGVLLLASVLFRFAFFPVCHGLWGQTPGKRLLGIRITRGSGEPLSLWRGFLREVFSWPGAVMGVYAVFALWAELGSVADVLEYQQRLSRFYYQEFRVLTPLLLFGGVILFTLSLLFFWMNSDRRIPHDYVADTFVSQAAEKQG